MVRKSRSTTNIKYINQIDKYSCGPIAILNVMRWAGCKTPYSYIYCLRSILNIRKEKGSWSTDIDRLLRCINKVHVLKHDFIKLEYINTVLTNNKIVVLQHPVKVNEGHFTIIVSKQNNRYKLLNPFYSSSYLSKSKLLKLLNRTWPDGVRNKAWIITKKTQS